MDGIIPEPPGGAQENYDQAAEYLRLALLGAIAELKPLSKEQLIEQRYAKFRAMGNFFTE